jgi:hypothetical protein
MNGVKNMPNSYSISLISAVPGVPDPDPNPDPDPRVFRPPGSGSGSISQKCGYGSGAIYHPSIIKQNSKKNLEFYCFVTYFILFSVKKMYLQKVISRKTFFY